MKTTLGILSVVLILFSVYVAGEHPREKPAQMATTAASTDTLTCSGPPCVLPPTQASEGGGVVTDTPIVMDPANRKDLLLGSFDANCSPAAVGFHLSVDGGSTWQRVLCMPFIYTKQYVFIPGGEPSVAYDSEGTAYASGYYFDNEGAGIGFIAVQGSADGNNWRKPVVALRHNPIGSYMIVDSSPFSRWFDTLYTSAVMVMGQNRNRNQVAVSHSSDRGRTWTQVPIDQVQNYPEEDIDTRLATGRNGTVYVSWLHCRGKKVEGGGLCPTVHAMFSKSTNGANSWSAPLRIATVGMPHYWQLPNTKFGEAVYNYPLIAVDNSNGPHSGNIYVAMYSWTGTYLRVQVIRSTDGGKTWSQPVPLAPKSDTHDQFFPAISVNSKGMVGVSWLDRRNDPANHDYQAFAAFSTDGGKTFSKNWQLTQAFSDPDADGLSYSWMGDYTGNTWMGDNIFVAAWMDSSNGVDMQEVVGGVRLK